MDSRMIRKRLVGRLALPLTLILLLSAGSITPVAADPGVIYVAPGAACDAGYTPCYGSVQAAVDAAASGDAIKVAAGTYTGVHNRPAPPGYAGATIVTQVVYVDRSVSIQGGYTTNFADPPDPESNPTTLDAQGQGRVLFVTSDIDTTIEGLRITGGDANGLGGGYWEFDCGGGVYLYRANSATTLIDNQVFDNTAGVGGGLCLYYGSATLNGNEVSLNSASSGGGLWLDRTEATLNGNTVSLNTSSGGVGGGGVYLLWGGVDTLTDNTIVSNTADFAGGGLYLDACQALLTGNVIRGNTASIGGIEWFQGGGGLQMRASDATLINNVIADNVAGPSGSGIKIRGGAPRLLHNTIARNTGGDGSGVYIRQEGTTYSAAALTNNVLVNHTVGVSVEAGNSATLNGVLWHGNAANTGGPGTIDVSNEHTGDPAFAADGYHLTADSAAIDRGVDAGVASDIDGDPRPMGHAYDLGADEFRVALKVTEHAHPDPVGPGEQLTYTFSVVNTGDVDLNATITDTLPTHVTAGGTAFLPGGGIGITWTAVITAPGGAWMETVVVTVAKGYAGPLTNLLEVTTEEGATGKAVVIVNAHRIYLPLVLR